LLVKRLPDIWPPQSLLEGEREDIAAGLLEGLSLLIQQPYRALEVIFM